jgi:prepilin-type N-terminal cleavage/methylation domain-containing protein
MMKRLHHILSALTRRKTNLKTDSRSLRDGFSLVEVSLALLVVSIGMLSLVGLFPVSLDMSKRAIDETYATFLADSAFASFRDAPFFTNTVTWSTITAYETIGPNTIGTGGTVNQDVFWNNSTNLQLKADGAVHTLIFIAGSTRGKWGQTSSWILPQSWSMEDHALRYRLRITDLGISDPRIKKMTMEVWMGQFGDTTKQKPEVFYSEIFRHES